MDECIETIITKTSVDVWDSIWVYIYRAKVKEHKERVEIGESKFQVEDV